MGDGNNKLGVEKPVNYFKGVSQPENTLGSISQYTEKGRMPFAEIDGQTTL